MDHDLELAVNQAIDLAIARRARLEALTLRGEDKDGTLAQRARRALAHLGAAHVDVRLEPGSERVRLGSVELALRSPDDARALSTQPR